MELKCAAETNLQDAKLVPINRAAVLEEQIRLRLKLMRLQVSYACAVIRSINRRLDIQTRLRMQFNSNFLYKKLITGYWCCATSLEVFDTINASLVGSWQD